MDKEMPKEFIELLENVKKKLKENANFAEKLQDEAPHSASENAERIADAKYMLKNAEATNMNSIKETQTYTEKVLADKRMLNALESIQNESKMHRPGVAKDALNQLLTNVGNETQSKTERLAARVASLEAPITRYQNIVNGLETPRSITKQELFEHVNRTVGICDNLFMAATSVHDQVEVFTKYTL